MLRRLVRDSVFIVSSSLVMPLIFIFYMAVLNSSGLYTTGAGMTYESYICGSDRGKRIGIGLGFCRYN